MTTLKDILLELPKLGKTDLEQIRQRILFLTGAVASKKAPPDTTFDWLLDGIKVEVEARGLKGTIPPDFRIKSHKSFAAYADKSERMRSWLEEAVPSMTRNEKRAMGLIVTRALARHIAGWTAPTFSTMLRYIDQLPNAIDRAFPGYIGARFLRMLLKSNRNGDHK